MFFIPKSRIDKVKRSWKRLPEPQILLDKSKELFNQESLRIFEAVDNVKAISGIRLFSFSDLNLLLSLSRFFLMIRRSVSTLASGVITSVDGGTEWLFIRRFILGNNQFPKDTKFTHQL